MGSIDRLTQSVDDIPVRGGTCTSKTTSSSGCVGKNVGRFSGPLVRVGADIGPVGASLGILGSDGSWPVFFQYCEKTERL